MTISDWLMISVTFLGPIVAVQLTRWLDNQKEKKDKKYQIFGVLMATRAYNFSYAHVEALNRIDLEFSEKSDKSVIGAWGAYHDHLNRFSSNDVWHEKRVSLFIDLLFEMSKNLGYDYDKTYIKNMAYSPERHGIVENEQDRLRQMLLNMLQQGSIPISITNFPSAQNQALPQSSSEKAL